MIPSELSDKSKAWCAEYIIDFNAKEAAIRVGVPAHQAEYFGANNKADVRCKALIYELKRRVSLRSEISADRTLELLRQIAETDITEVLEVVIDSPDMPTLMSRFKALPEAVRAAVKSVKWGKNGPEIIMHDKMAAILNVGKYFGLFNDRLEVSGPGGGAIPMITTTMTPKEAADAYAAALKGVTP